MAVLALAVRTFFGFPASVPTGSMEPTIQGTQIEDLDLAPEAPPAIDSWVSWLRNWIHGVRILAPRAEEEGRLSLLDPVPTRFAPWLTRQRLQVGARVYYLWNGPREFLEILSVEAGDEFEQGDLLFQAKLTSGDWLWVDRIRANFGRMTPGRVVVWENRGVTQLPQGQIFVKRVRRVDNRPSIQTQGERSSSRNQWLFLAGDNPGVSSDSREWGTVPIEWAMGIAGPILWPVSPRQLTIPR